MDLPDVGDWVWVLRDDGRTLVRPYRMRIYDRSGGEQPDGSWRLVRYRIGGLSCQYPWYQLARERPKETRA